MESVKKNFSPKQEDTGVENRMCTPVGARARTRDLPCARRDSVAACHCVCFDK